VTLVAPRAGMSTSVVVSRVSSRAKLFFKSRVTF
jgi:cellobiose-specific phosphotransferase system component IIB